MQRSKHKPYYFNAWAFLLLLLFLLSACSSKNAPAPVVNLSTKTASPENLTQITSDTYTVELGDTLFAIAFYSGNDYRELAKINRIPPPYRIKLGQSLRLKPVFAEPIIKKPIDSTYAKRAVKPKPTLHSQQQGNTARGHTSPKYTSGYETGVLNSRRKLYWAWPAKGSRTVATVGSDGSKRGVDIKGKLGTKVVAAGSGKVVYAGNALKGYGKLIIIKHNSEYLSAYAHNDVILVAEQTYVKQGQQIATMGNTGASEVMLHFEIRRKGKSVDPFKYLPAK